MADIEAIIREERAREREDALTDDHPFVKRVMDQIDQRGFFTAGQWNGEPEALAILTHPRPMPNREIMFHNHNFFELAFVYRGSCRNKLKNYEITLTQGDLLLLNPNAVHCLCTDSDEDVVFNFLFPVSLFDNAFIGLLPDNPISDFFMDYFYQTRTGEDFIVVNAGPGEELIRLLEQLIVEYHDRQPGYETILRAGLAQVFVHMARRYAEKLRDLPLQHTSRVVRGLMLYVTRNAATVTLSDAARELNYTEKHLSRLMKRELGLSFTQFVRRQRLQYAAELLTKTNLNIEEVIHMVGYTNASHFYDLFQKQFDMTPAAYRERLAAG